MASAKRLSARVGEQLYIELPSNPSTGYFWEAHVDHPDIQVREAGFRSGHGGIGGGGVQVFGVSARARGEYAIRLAYRRPWEKEPAREDVYVVTAE